MREPPRNKPKAPPSPEPSVEIDPEALAQEQKVVETYKPKPMVPPEPLQLDRPDLKAMEENLVAPGPTFWNRLRGMRLPRLRFVKKRTLVLIMLLAAAWGFNKVSEEKVLSLALQNCGDRASALPQAVAYQSVLPVEIFSQMLGWGPLLCNGEWSCWSQWKPWLAISFSRLPELSGSEMGESFVGKEAPMAVFYRKDKAEVRARAINISARGKITLGLEECLFSVQEDQAGPLARKSAALVAGLLARDPSPAVVSEAAPTPGKEKSNVELFNRFRRWVSTGVF